MSGFAGDMLDEAHRTKRPSSKTKLYDTLGVDRNANKTDLKKAYRKKALQNHPDKKGGSCEAFKDLKYAYDALNDPTMRFVNDKFGDVGVQVYSNGSMGLDEAHAIYVQLDAWDRTVIVMAVVVCLGYLLLFPILLSIRWDHPNSMHFAHVFIPVWLGLSAILVCCLGSIFVSSSEVDESADQERRKRRCVGVVGSLFVVMLFVLLILLVLRLDGHTDWSYMWVIWPWILLEVAMLVQTVCLKVYVYFAKQDEPDEESPLELAVTIAATVCPNIFSIIFVIHLAWKMDGMPISWWEVFWPIWVSAGLVVILQCTRCMFIKPEVALHGDKEASELNMQRKATIYGSIISQIIWVGVALLLCFKLAHPNAFPAFVIFLPLFVIAGCVCCLTTCFICCGPAERDDEVTMRDAMAPPRGSTYNTV